MKKILALALTLVFGLNVFAQTPSVTTTIDNLTPTTITASFDMDENCTKYHILASAVGEMDQLVQMFGTPLRDLVISWSLGFESDTTYTWTDMAPNTDYIVYVVAVNATDTSEVLMTTCTTPQAGGEGASVVTIELSNITETSVIMTATPNDQTSRFLDGLVEKALLDEIGQDSLMTMLVAQPYWLYETDVWEWLDLTPGMEYYAFAIGQNAAEQWGEMTIVPFATLLMAQTRFWIGDIQYEITSTNPAEVEVYDANTSITTANIPETVSYGGTDYSVTSIGYSAFIDCSSLTSVTIPNSVTSIGICAFEDCSSLTSITIPNSVTSIGGSVFWNCSSLTSVTIGNSVTSIGNIAFAGCSSLTSVTIPNSVTSIGYSMFQNCSSLTSVTIGNSVTSIGYRMFYNCSSLTSITIPNSVTSIEGGAFESCSSLTSVTIPNSVTSIGTGVFRDCSSLTSITIPNSVTSIGGGAFENCSSLTSVTIPNSVTSIGNTTFYGCSSLTSITIPNSVTSIGDSAFSYCSSLTSIDIPNSVTSIGEDAFLNCSSLTSLSIDWTSVPNLSNIGLNSSLQNLTLGENVTSIASGAFSPYSFLQNITCLATTPPTIADNTVFPYPNIATLTVPCGTLEAYSSATSFWNMFFMGRISEDGYEVVANVNNDAFGSVAIENNCSTATLTATANEGYVFLSWNDGNTENPRTVALTSDTAFTAIFALIDESSLLEAETESISFFPNPTSSKVSFNQTIEKVEVIDLSGKTLFTFSNANSINIESLPAGAYYLRLTNNDKAVLRKLIKE